MTLLGPDGSPLPPSARVAAGAGAMRAFGVAIGRSYQGASLTDPDLASWTVANPSPQLAVTSDRAILAARVHDLARNDGWAAGGVARMVDAIIGSNWRLSARPNAKALGIDQDEADAVAEQIESLWRPYASGVDNAIDAGERLNWGGLLALNFRHRIWDGEAIAVSLWLKRSWAYSTCIQTIHPDRLSNPYNGPDTLYLRAGVEIGDRGQPLAYHFRSTHPGDQYFANPKLFTWDRVVRRTAWGRATVVHAFEPQAADQFRGVSPLAPILKKIRMLGRYDEAELQASVLNAILAAFVTSPFDAEQLAETMSADALSPYQDMRAEWHESNRVRLSGAQVNFLAPGEEIKLSSPNHPNSVYEAFERTALRNVATAIGVSYEQLSMDWSQVNYSSARAALLEIWRGFTSRKDNFAHQFAQPIYANWLEEAVDRGDVNLPKKAPKFLEAKSAWCESKWVGPGRGWVDPQKEALAAITRMDGGLSTMEHECDEQGMDWRVVLVQQAREYKEREKLGLPPLIPMQAARTLLTMPAEDIDDKAKAGDKKDGAPPPPPPPRKQQAA
jgi:lambda family phage portal protein